MTSTLMAEPRSKDQIRKEPRTNLNRQDSHGDCDTKGQMSDSEASDGEPLEPIAVIGLSCKFPDDATSPERFWDMIMKKKCASKNYPPDRMNIDAFYHPNAQKLNTISTKGAHFIQEDVRAFDAPFFSVPPQEAGTMDPQHRGLLEVTYQALENGGIPMERIAGTNTSVHVGCFTADYITTNWRDSQQIPKYSATGTAASILANRLSWFYDLRGPSMTVDTACSSGMVAMDLACNGIWSGTSDIAIVAGANIISSPELNIALSNMNFLSPEAKCYSFDHRASGYARGEGFGVLVLKPVSQAVRDGNTIRALIRSVGVNQDGHTDGGITQPSKDLQARLIRDTYKKAGLDMRTTRFFEAHGTGTPIGDPIEARAMGECFRIYRSPEEPLYIGAVKSNIGHLEGSSGIAGIIKAISAVEKGIIPPNTNFEELNPYIDADFYNIKFPSKSIPWPSQGARRASVNSFGFGGTNGHVVLDDAYHYLVSRNLPGVHFTAIEPPKTNILDLPNGPGFVQSISIEEAERCSEVQPRLLVWSTADEGGLQRLCSDYKQYIADNTYIRDPRFLDNLAWTLNKQRSCLAWKSYAVVASIEELTNLEEAMSTPVRPTAFRPRLGFAFTGQGVQWYAMGRELLDYPLFKASLLRSQACLKGLGCAWNLIDELIKDQTTTRINDPRLSQPLCTALQIALVDLYDSLGVNPTVVVGHSSGEISAAYCAGFLSQTSAMTVAYHRGALSSELARSDSLNWSMISVGLSAFSAQEQIHDLQSKHPQLFQDTDLTISCINSPSSVTISGPSHLLDLLVNLLQDQNVFSRRLSVNLGYHSSQMKSIASKYLAQLQGLEKRKRPSHTTMMSSVTCRRVNADSACSGHYWVQNLISPVRFCEAMTACCFRPSKEGIIKKLDRSHIEEIVTDAWVELGPHSGLRGPICDILTSVDRNNDVTYDSALVRDLSASYTFLNTLGRLHCQGFHVDLENWKWSHSATSESLAVLPDLPQYPFNHSTIYWEEPHSNRNLVFRQHARHDLVGSQVIDWNPRDAKWKFIIKAEELPWIVDHKINGSILYPAAGMLVAAIEAIRMIVEGTSPIGYEITDAEFSAPLLLTTSATGTEVHISLNSPTRTNARNDTNFSFRLFTRKPDESWDEICRGYIRADYGNAISDVDNGKEAQEILSNVRNLHVDGRTSCTLKVDTANMYEQLRDEAGIDYGSSFQVLAHIRYNNEGEAMAVIKLPESDTAHSCSPHVIHPTTLDGLFQLLFVALTKGGTSSLQTMVPTRISRLWVSSKIQTDFPPPHLELHSRAKFLSRRHAQCSISALNEMGQGLQIQIEDLETTAVSEHANSSTELEKVKNICYHMCWKPDLDAIENNSIEKYCKVHLSKAVEPRQWFIDLKLLTLCFSAQALVYIKGVSTDLPKPTARYVSWIQMQVDRHIAAVPLESRQQHVELLHEISYLELLIKVVLVNKRGELHVKVGKELSSIFAGVTDPLEFLFRKQNDLVDFYTEMVMCSQAFDAAVKYLDVLVHKDPSLKFIEIGAGTGATTRQLLKTLAATSKTPLFRQYVYTDISPAFIEKSRDGFHDQKRMDFRVLNIEEDPCAQGFSEGQYDVLVASLVLHATKDLSITVQNARKLLKPGGKLILIELTAPEDIRTGFVFGLLPGWWLGTEHFRKQSPCVSVDTWNEILLQNGFSGNDLVFRDYESKECQIWSLIVSTAMETTASVAPKLPNLSVILDRKSKDQQEVAQQLITIPDVSNAPIQMLSMDEAVMLPEPNSEHLIMLMGFTSDFFVNIDRAVFAALQKLLTTSASVLWVTKGGGRAPSSPYYAILQGLCRVCSNENPKTALVTLELDESTSFLSPTKSGALISNVLQKTIRELSNGSYEPEYREVEGLLHINRLVEAEEPNEHIFSRTAQPVRTQELGDSPPLKLHVKTPGLLDSLEFAEDISFEKSLLPDEIEVDVRAIGVNFKECLIALGRVKSDNLGSECAGVVLRAGSQCTQFQPGDRVTLCDLDCYRTRIRVKHGQAVKVPDCMSFVEAASIPTAFSTALYSLEEVARLQEDESILIHAGSGGTGQAAIQVAANIGAEIFVTVGSAQKKTLLMDTYGLTEDHIFYSRDTSFANGVKRMTGGNGVDVVLNSLSGDGLVASWNCLAPFGRFLEIGRKDIDARGNLPMAPFINNVSFIGVDLAGIANQRTAVGRRLLQKAVSMFETKRFHSPYPLQAYPLGDIEKAFRLLQSGKTSGKIVLEVEPRVTIPIVSRARSDYSFDGEKTFLIAGGLGGLGRSIARWLVRRGARNLMLLSRSGPDGNDEALAMLKDLREMRILVECPICDITDVGSLQSVLQQYSKIMPPIKGCFQASMVLRDATFARMSYENWTQSVAPKVQGSWNLHETLPKCLDFFIMLSSVCGIFGNGGQSNYAAGNTFQDSLAQYRVTSGEKATSLDLGIILSEGFVAENQQVMDHLMRLSLLMPISPDALFALLDRYCDPALQIADPVESQVITGLELPADQQAKGKDVLVAMHKPLFRHMHAMDPSSSLVSSSSLSNGKDPFHQDLKTQLAAATTSAEAASVVSQALRMKLSKMLGVGYEQIELQSRVESYGVDSLVAVELRNWLAKEVDADIAVFEILGAATLESVGTVAAAKTSFRKS